MNLKINLKLFARVGYALGMIQRAWVVGFLAAVLSFGFESDLTFMAAIRERPGEDAARLVYADWLEEHGQRDRAHFIRLQIERIRLPTGDERRGACAREESELLEKHPEWVPASVRELMKEGRSSFRLNWVRGFVHEVLIGSHMLVWHDVDKALASLPLLKAIHLLRTATGYNEWVGVTNAASLSTFSNFRSVGFTHHEPSVDFVQALNQMPLSGVLRLSVRSAENHELQFHGGEELPTFAMFVRGHAFSELEFGDTHGEDLISLSENGAFAELRALTIRLGGYRRRTDHADLSFLSLSPQSLPNLSRLELRNIALPERPEPDGALDPLTQLLSYFPKHLPQIRQLRLNFVNRTGPNRNLPSQELKQVDVFLKALARAETQLVDIEISYGPEDQEKRIELPPSLEQRLTKNREKYGCAMLLEWYDN